MTFTYIKRAIGLTILAGIGLGVFISLGSALLILCGFTFAGLGILALLNWLLK